MSTDKTRYITEKWYANEREKEILDSHCAANDVSKSEFVRRVVMRALHPQTNRKRERLRREGPELGPVLDAIFPGRSVSAPVPLRL